jgi:hypothetical protein
LRARAVLMLVFGMASAQTILFLHGDVDSGIVSW